MADEFLILYEASNKENEENRKRIFDMLSGDKPRPFHNEAFLKLINFVFGELKEIDNGR